MGLWDVLYWLKSGTTDETNGRHVIPDEAIKATDALHSPLIIDVGAGHGQDLREIGRLLRERGKIPQLFAIESFPISVDILRKSGIDVKSVDIEHDPFPFSSSTFDLVICNQVLEHTKEIFWVIGELSRILKPGGILILGVPNLGSLHNRVSLLFGKQPPAINVFGAHVRGFTVPGLREFLESGKCLTVLNILGGNFYPFPPLISRALAKIAPRLAVSSFYIIQRIGSKNFLEVLDTPKADCLVDTPYFRGVGPKPAERSF